MTIQGADVKGQLANELHPNSFRALTLVSLGQLRRNCRTARTVLGAKSQAVPVPQPFVPRAAARLETATQLEEATEEAALNVEFRNGAARTRAVPVPQPQFHQLAEKAAAYP